MLIREIEGQNSSAFSQEGAGFPLALRAREDDWAGVIASDTTRNDPSCSARRRIELLLGR